MLIVKSLLYFLLAGLCEIGGGYLMWLWLREGRSLIFGLSGAAILIVYGIVPTLAAGRKLWARLRRVRRNFHCALHSLGLAHRQCAA